MDLRQAARLNDIKCVESLLRDGVDVNAMNICNQTALYYTCFHGHEQLTELLLSAGADSNIGAKPLNAAIANYRNKCVEILLRSGTNVNNASCTEKSALFVAFERRNYTAAELLIDNGADVNFCYISGQDHNIFVSDILFRNAGRTKMKLVEKILKKTVENNNILAASRYAFKFGILDFARSLLSMESSNNIQEHYSFALSSCALYNWLDVAKMLLNIGVKINSFYDDHTALQTASGAGHERMVELLLQHGADVNLYDKSSRSAQKHLLHEGTAHGQQLKSGCNSAFHLAFANGNIAICEMLIASGANVDCVNDESMTLLHMAASLCDIDRVKWLIEKHKINTICCDWLNRSALHFVCDSATADNSRCLAVVKILLDNGTLIDVVSASNETPLYIATKRGRVDVVRTLLAAGAKSHIAGSLNPLTEASQQGNIELVRLLLENSEVPSTKSLCAAIQQRHCDVIELLLNSGMAVDEVMDNGQLPVGAFLESLANLAGEECSPPAPKRARCDTHDKLWVLFETLVEKMDDINILDGLGFTPLHTACSLGLVNAAKILINHGANHAMLTLFGVTPLHQACCDGKVEIVRLLLHHVDLTQLDFRSLMTAAVSRGSGRSRAVVICLLRCQGIDVSCLSTFSHNSQLHSDDTFVSDPIQMVHLLEAACAHERLDIVEVLLNAGVFPVECHNLCNVLINTCLNNQVKILELLLNHGVSPNCMRLGDRYSALCIACEKGFVHIADVLMRAGAYVSFITFRIAVVNNQADILALLLKNCDVVNAELEAPVLLFDSLSPRPNIQMLKLLLTTYSACVNTCYPLFGETPLHCAIKLHHLDRSGFETAIRALLAASPDKNVVDLDGKTALCLALEQNLPTSLIELLLNKGADPDIGVFPSLSTGNLELTKSPNLLTEPSDQGNIELVRLLLENNEVPSTMSLCVAIQHRDCDLIELLLNSGMAVDEVMDNGQLPVGAFMESLANLAAEECSPPAPKRARCDTHDKLWVLFETLVEKMNDINILDGLGFTPLHTACSLGLVNAAKILINHGANHAMLTLFGVTPLHQACCDGKVEIVRLLLHHVDLTQLDFRSLMTAAVSRGSGRSRAVVICLLRCQGIDVSCLSTFSHNSQLHSDETFLSASTAEVSDPIQMVQLLEAACEYERLDIVEVLLNTGVFPVECHNLCHILINTCKNDQVKILELLLNHGVSPNCMRLDDRHSALCIACEKGFVHIADVLMLAGAYVSFIALRIAVVNNRTDVVALLLKNCDVVNAELEAPVLLFDSLSPQPNIQMLKLLLTTYSACVNTCYPLFGETPLHCAIKLHHLDRSCFETAIRALLAASPDKNVVDFDGKTALCLAVEQNLPMSLIELLLTRGADPIGLFPLLSTGNLKLTELLIKEVINEAKHTDKNKWSALHHLLHNFQPTEKSTGITPCSQKSNTVNLWAKLLLRKGADPNLRSIVGVSPFHLACRCNDPNLVECLLQHGADVDQCLSPLRPLALACQKTHLAVLQLLLNKGANPNIESTNVADMLPEKFMSYLSNILGDLVDQFTSILPLCIAVMLGESEVVQLLLKHGAYVNAIDDGIQMTALHAAVACVKSPAEFATHHEVITLLLSSGAHVNALDKNGRTALYHAAMNGREDVVALLTSQGANPNVASANMFPLCAACAGNHVSIVRLLLESGADVNPKQQPPDRLSSCVPTLPLGSAAYAGHPELIKLLLHSGADVIGIDRNGWTALLRASENFRCIALAHSRTLPGAVVLPDVPVIHSALACIVQLLDAGADANVSDPLGQTAIGHILSLLLDPFFFRLRYTAFCQAINEAVTQLMDHGSAISELHLHREEPEQNITLKNFMVTDTRCCQFATKLFKAGAGLRFVSAYLKAMSAESSPASDVLCRAVVLSGYKVTEADLSDFLSIRDVDNADEHALLAVESFERWLNDFQKKPPNLMMQCRIVVRQQLSAAHNFCDITASVSSLVLPKTLNQYLMFEGPMSEVDLSMVTDAVAMDSSE